jgi:hypothetical protein
VDKASYPDFIRFMKWSQPPEFQECQPTLAPGRSPRSTSSSDSHPIRETSRGRSSPPRKRGRVSSPSPVDARARIKEPRPSRVEKPVMNPTVSLTSTSTVPVGRPTTATQTELSKEVPAALQGVNTKQLAVLQTTAMLRLHAAQLEATAIALRKQADELEKDFTSLTP